VRRKQGAFGIEREFERAGNSRTKRENSARSRIWRSSGNRVVQIQLDRLWLHYWRGDAADAIAIAGCASTSDRAPQPPKEETFFTASS
jgi:hypothetical protein